MVTGKNLDIVDEESYLVKVRERGSDDASYIQAYDYNIYSNEVIYSVTFDRSWDAAEFLIRNTDTDGQVMEIDSLSIERVDWEKIEAMEYW